MITVTEDYRNAIYAPIRQIDARVHFTLFGETKTYYDDRIIRFNIVEERETVADTLPANEISLTLDNLDNEFNLLSLSNMDQVLASRPTIEIEFGLVYDDSVFLTFYQADSDGESTEWIPMGTFYLAEWKNEREAKTITLVARDNLDYLSNTPYKNTMFEGNMYQLAEDVFIKAGVTDYEIDNNLKTVITSGFKEKLDSRTALQHIGIATRSAIYQDRYGIMVIKPFEVLDASSNYLTFPTQDYYHFGSLYPLVTSGFGMRNIDFDDMYEEPEITLDKSIYSVSINIYDGEETREKSYINNEINGRYGDSFSLDNPLIVNDSMADSVADWIIKESKYNAIYKVNWRQNPALECTDVVIIEDGMNAMKQSRIYRQEYAYEGYLTGITESRGGI